MSSWFCHISFSEHPTDKFWTSFHICQENKCCLTLFDHIIIGLLWVDIPCLIYSLYIYILYIPYIYIYSLYIYICIPYIYIYIHTYIYIYYIYSLYIYIYLIVGFSPRIFPSIGFFGGFATISGRQVAAFGPYGLAICQVTVITGSQRRNDEAR